MPVYENLKTPTPFYAVVGAGDLVVEKLRDAGTDAQDRVSKATKIRFEPKKFQSDAKKLQVRVRDAAQERVSRVTEDVRSVATDVRGVPSKAQATVNDWVSQAGSTYDELAARGKELIENLREQQESFDLQEQVKKTFGRVTGQAPQNGRSAASKSAAKKPAAKKSTAKSSTKSSSAKSSASKSTAKKSTSKSTAAKKTGK